MKRYRLFLLACCLAGPLAGSAVAHPVPRDHHDRTIVVGLQADQDGRVTVLVDYRLEVDELTVLLDDMRPFRDEVDPALFRKKPLAYYGEFARIYGPILAKNLTARINDRVLQFQCVERRPRLTDDKGEPLGHLRCDFVFRAAASVTVSADQHLTFSETNYHDQSGKIDLALGETQGLRILGKVVPDQALKNRPAIELRPGDEQKLRSLEARFHLVPDKAATLWPKQRAKKPAAVVPKEAPPKPAPVLPREADTPRKSPEKSLPEPGPEKTPPLPESGPTEQPAATNHYDLLDLFRRTDLGLVFLLFLAAIFGAAHALTPGHGKTLVAAYLVGQRGTIGHAIVLGLITTLTHTGIVLLIALVLFFLPESAGARPVVQEGLGLIMGLLVAGFGLWLLLQRLAGRADHFHLGGGHHHHHHGQVHSHDQAHAIAAGYPPLATPFADSAAAPTWKGLVLLGMTGGIVPCWDAIVLLLVTIGSSAFWLALPLLLAFSAGLAGVLVLIGILVVQTRGFLASRWGEGKLVRALPLMSAVAITALGFWLAASHLPQ